MKKVPIFEATNDYPTVKWVISTLRNNLHSRVDYKVLSAYIVGSEAKGTAIKGSDLDIAVIIPKSDKIAAIKRTENYHNKFKSDNHKPSWNGRIVDIQFFDDENDLKDYSKIKLK